MLPCLFHTSCNFLLMAFCLPDSMPCVMICHMQFNWLFKWPTLFQIPHNNSSRTTSLYELFSWTGMILVPYNTTPLHELFDCTSDVLCMVALAASKHDVFFHLSVLPLTYPFILPTAVNPFWVECWTWKLVSAFHFCH